MTSDLENCTLLSKMSLTIQCGIVLVDFLLLWQNYMTKNSQRKKKFILAKNSRDMQFMNGSEAIAVTAGARRWLSNFIHIQGTEREKEERWGYNLKTHLKWSGLSPPTRLHLLKVAWTSTNNSTNWRSSIQMHEPIVGISISIHKSMTAFHNFYGLF